MWRISRQCVEAALGLMIHAVHIDTFFYSGVIDRITEVHYREKEQEQIGYYWKWKLPRFLLHYFGRKD